MGVPQTDTFEPTPVGKAVREIQRYQHRWNWAKFANGFFCGSLIGVTLAVVWAFLVGWPN